MPKTPATPRPEEEAEAAGGVNGELEEAEDDAPEAVQAQNQHQSSNQQQWSTFPDLLRVQRSKCRADSGADDHAAEGQEPGAIQALRAVQISSPESTRSTGTVPKRMPRPSAPPDLTSRRADSNRTAAASHDNDVRVERLEREVDQLRTERVAMQQQRSTDEAKEAELRHVNEVHVQLAAISASVQTLNQTIIAMSQTVNQRLDHLESRLNDLVSADCGALANNETAPLRRQIASLITNQKRELAEERRFCLSSLADALKSAAAQSGDPASGVGPASSSSFNSGKQNGPTDRNPV